MVTTTTIKNKILYNAAYEDAWDANDLLCMI